jgi:lysophospholipase L1-like esterase
VDYIFTWSKSGDYIRLYNGPTLLGQVTGLGTWNPSSIAVIKIGMADGDSWWLGDIAHLAIWNKPLSTAEMVPLHKETYIPSDGYLGGSITVGSNASDVAHRYYSLVHTWLNTTTYPNALPGNVVSALGGSHSFENLQRLDALIAQRPRTIVVDSAVNDDDDNLSRYCAEAVIHKIRTSLPNTKIIGLLNIRVADHTTNDTTNTNVAQHTDWVNLLTQYTIPYADFAAEVQSKVPGTHNLNWYFPDSEVHPGDNGHATIATLLEAQLALFTPPASVPARLRADSVDFEYTPQYVNASDCAMTGNWALDANGAYVATQTNSTMAFPSAMTFRGLGVDTGDNSWSYINPTCSVSYDGGTNWSDIYPMQSGNDVGSRASRTVMIKSKSATALKIKRFTLI